MADTRRLRLRLILPSEKPIAPTEFRDLFALTERISRAIAQREALRFLESLGLSSQQRLAIVQRRPYQRRVPTPAEVVEVSRGSWTVAVLLGGQVLLYMLKNYVDPLVQEAWNESELRADIHRFLQERIFRGVAKDVEEAAARSPREGNLEVVAVEEGEDSRSPEAVLEIHLTRREIMEVRLEDQELVEEFVRRLHAS